MSIQALETRLNNICMEEEKQNSESVEKWGMQLKDLYRLAMSFYKEKSGKAIHLSYEDNLKLIAFTQQATHGPYKSNSAPPPGVLDVIGKDRRVAWQSLGDITKIQAMEGFINLLDRLCPAFKPYVEAVKKDREEKLRQDLEEKRKQQENLEKQKQLLEDQKRMEDQKNQEEYQKRQLQEALNQQTYHQFKAYAEKQFPGNPEQQAILIRQLQNEHYHQYIQQLQSQIRPIANIAETAKEEDHNENSKHLVIESQPNTTEECEDENCCSGEEKCEEGEDCEYLTASPAKMWTRPDIKSFKMEVSAGRGEGVIHVGHGDTVTVRVPTHKGGTCIFWEFATDNYDIGFGVYFEWGSPETSEVTVHVSESEDEDLYEEDEDEYSPGDLECGPVQAAYRNPIAQHRPPISIIIPVYRRECHNEVYVGSHTYPGEGVYLLKFDNTFSVWRSKTLYYRVYYER